MVRKGSRPGFLQLSAQIAGRKAETVVKGARKIRRIGKAEMGADQRDRRGGVADQPMGAAHALLAQPSKGRLPAAGLEGFVELAAIAAEQPCELLQRGRIGVSFWLRQA